MSGGDSGPSLCGVWISPEGQTHLAWDDGEGARKTEIVGFSPFVWAMDSALGDLVVGASVTSLSGSAAYNHLVAFEDIEDYREFVKEKRRTGSIDWIRQLEQQYLLSHQTRFFEEMPFLELRRMQLDIETACSEKGGFSDPKRKEDRVLAIGVQCGNKLETLVLAERTDEAERYLLGQLNERFQDWDPDVVEGHNIFKFDFEYLRRRCQILKVPMQWGRFGQRRLLETVD